MDRFIEKIVSRHDPLLSLIARLLAATLFLMAGMDAGMDLQAFAERLARDGLPVHLSGFVFYFLLISGLGLALGIQTRLLALAMAGFSLLSGFMAYADLDAPTDMVMLLKNISLAGGYLFVALHGPGAFSVDAWLARRRARAA